MLELFVHASWLIKVVLVVLGVLSVFSWCIIVYKVLHLQMASQESATLLATLRACESDGDLAALFKAAEALHISPLAAMATAAASGMKRRSREDLGRVLKSCQAQETAKLESYLTFLATTGATAPFIGLLGTVWGIMDAFKGIGAAGSASLAVVAPAIAEALVTTAAGLAAAIPAVMAYNFLLNWIGQMTNTVDDFSEAFQHALSRKAA